MAGLGDYDDEITEGLRDVERSVEALAVAHDPRMRGELTARIDGRLRQLRRLAVSYRQECRHCTDTATRTRHEATHAEHADGIRRLERKYDDVRCGGPTSSSATIAATKNATDTRGVFLQIDAVQDASLAALARVRDMGTEALSVCFLSARRRRPWPSTPA